MAKKKKYFAKSVLINGESRIEPGEEVTGLKKEQVDRLLVLDAITEDEIEGEEDNGEDSGKGEGK